MTKKELQKSEDVAAVLAGKIKCPGCMGRGFTYAPWRGSEDPDDQEIAENVDEQTRTCKFCSGKRWVSESKKIEVDFAEIELRMLSRVGTTITYGKK